MENRSSGHNKRAITFFSVAILTLFPVAAWAGDPGAHVDPVGFAALALGIVLITAKIGGELAVRLGQPSVLGEIIGGVLLGNLSLLGVEEVELLRHDPTIDMASRIGVLILLFEVGVESTVGQMMKVGWSSLFVALLGVAVPFALGWSVGLWLLPGESVFVHAFLGAALCATSVGITARVLKDLNLSRTSESRIVLGAAVMDDVLGLTVLAVVTGVIAAANEGTKLSATDVGIILAKCTAFLVGSIVLGVLFSKRIFFFASKLRAPGVLLAAGLSFCFFMSWLAGFIGLAPIVGAFSAGLILEEIHSEKFVERGEPPLDTLLRPISSFLVPIFFVVIGMRTDLKSFLQEGIWGLAAALTIAAIIGKLICAAGVLGKNVDRLTIGIGMIPRGEVGLIFAGIGTSLTIAGRPILSDAIFSAIVVMVIVTTVMTPPSLKWSTGRRRQSGPSNAGAE